MGQPGSFLCLGASFDDYEMTANSSEENRGGSLSPNESGQNSGILSSTMTSLSDDRNSADSMEKKIHLSGRDTSNSMSVSITNEANHSPSSIKESEVKSKKESSLKEEETNKEGENGFGKSYSGPMPNMNVEVEQSAMQQQIVDMYMRSMQQFTESLAKMKLPMDLDKPKESEDCGDVIDIHAKIEAEKTKKDGSRVFYGSSAFF